ncbi:MAG: peptide ABC transporter substrate-binding protein [Schleiferilactobacillus harbinensis]|jgi:oligopeptide transport system substrate-binding protein|nr:peptide ABC transporter substrate-binding protein [Schleiferilactobacillus harbinensis]MCI1913887.1 peptide ABC transporter substrate-binding protein [Schleiferilactobacillus harbinensis]
MRKAMKQTLVMTVAATAVLLTACNSKSTSSTQSSTAKVTWSRMEKDNITTMDPSRATDTISYQALKDTMDGLYSYSGKKLVPAMATKIVKPTNNGKTYTFKLRNAKWHDGTPVTAKDFVYAWQRTVDPATKSESAYEYAGIKNANDIIAGKKKASALGVKALDAHTLQVTLAQPIPYFPTMLVNPPFFPQNEKTVKAAGAKYGSTSKDIMGNGAFVLGDWNGTGTAWKENKAKNYWNAKNVHIDQISVTAIKDSATAMNLFQSGKLDDATLSGDQAAQAKTNKDYKGIKQASSYFMYLNVKKVPALKNAKIRQSFSMMINRPEFIRKVLQDGSLNATGVTPTNMADIPATKQDFAKAAAKGYTQYTTYSPKEAKTLWSAGMKEAGLKDLTLTLLIDDTDNSKKSAEYFQNTLEKLPGLHVNITSVPFKTRLSRTLGGDFDISLGGWAATFPDPVNFLDLFTTGATYNLGKWSNTKFDKLIEASKTTDVLDTNKRWQDLLDAQHILTKEMGVIPLYQMVQAHLVNPKMQNLKTGPGGAYNFVGATIK